jgi:Conserved mid region of cactin
MENQKRSHSPSSRHRRHHRHHDLSKDRRDRDDHKRRGSEENGKGRERKRPRTPTNDDHWSKESERRDRRGRNGKTEIDKYSERRRDDLREKGTLQKDVPSIFSLLIFQNQLKELIRGREAREQNFYKQEREQTQFRNEEEDVHYKEWLAKEDDFMLIQAKKRAVIRVREGRAKPIDAFVINLKLIEEDERPRVLGDDEIDEGPAFITEPDDVIKVFSSECYSNSRNYQ